MNTRCNTFTRTLLPAILVTFLAASPAFAEEKAAAACGVTSTRKVTLELNSARLGKVMSALAKQGGFSYIFSGFDPEVTVVNLFFQGVPVNEAVDAIASALGLKCEKRGSLVVIGIPGKGAFAPEPGR